MGEIYSQSSRIYVSGKNRRSYAAGSRAYPGEDSPKYGVHPSWDNLKGMSSVKRVMTILERPANPKYKWGILCEWCRWFSHALCEPLHATRFAVGSAVPRSRAEDARIVVKPVRHVLLTGLITPISNWLSFFLKLGFFAGCAFGIRKASSMRMRLFGQRR